MGKNTTAEWVTEFLFQGDTAGILIRLNSQTTHVDCFSPACGSSKSSGILEQILMDGDDYSLQIVVTSWNLGENSSNFLLPGEDKIITRVGDDPKCSIPHPHFGMEWCAVVLCQLTQYSQCGSAPWREVQQLGNHGRQPEPTQTLQKPLKRRTEASPCGNKHKDPCKTVKRAASTLELVPGAEISDVTDATSVVIFKELQHRPTGTSGIRYKRAFTFYQHFRMPWFPPQKKLMNTSFTEPSRNHGRIETKNMFSS